MQKKIKIYFLYPLTIALLFLFFYALYLWSTNFTPRMFFYSQYVQSKQISDFETEIIIKSDEDYLGIISIKSLGEYIDFEAKSLEISLYDSVSNELVHSNQYNAYDLINVEEFPFGFPVQESSKNKTYKIIAKISCFDQLNCTFKPKIEQVIVRHYFSKKFLLTNPDFIIKKIVVNFSNQGFAKNFAIIAAPIVIYLATIIFFAKYIKVYLLKVKDTLLSKISYYDFAIYALILIDLIVQNNMMFFISLIILFIFLFKMNRKHREQLAIRNTLATFFLSIIFIIINIRSVGDRISIWTFVFYITYIFQLFFPTKLMKS